MALVTIDFNINITPGEMPPVIHVSEYDIGRSYNVSLIDENGNAFQIPTGTTATVEGTLNGVVGFSVAATISNNKVAFTLTESMTAYAGKAWCKIKLTLNSQPIQTCAFVLAVDRAGVEAETVIGADGFEQQIVNAVNDWLDEHPPASGSMTEEFKQALLDCFENVAWINDQGQTYYDALYAALYPPVEVLSISAVFTQGSAVIYDTDSLDTLKQYLVVTATMTDSTIRTLQDSDYTLSGTLTVGTSTITVSYGGKTTTFTVNVTEDPGLYQAVSYITADQTGGAQYVTPQYIVVPEMASDTTKQYRIETSIKWSANQAYSTRGMGYNKFGFFTNNNGKYYADATNTNVTASTSNFDVIAMDINPITMKNVLTINGASFNSQRSAVEADVYLSLFGLDAIDAPTHAHKTFFPASCSMKYWKLYVDGDLILDMIPAVRNADGKAGMLDRVNMAFYPSAGTADFTYTE